MARLIDADALTNHKFPEANDVFMFGWNEGIRAVIENAPTVDAVEVVRCEECVHYKPQKQSFKWAGTVKYCVRSAAVKMPPDGFCSCGQRKGDGNV